jgi:hypothetical protein
MKIPNDVESRRTKTLLTAFGPNLAEALIFRVFSSVVFLFDQEIKWSENSRKRTS